jgi:hypothetical protein
LYANYERQPRAGVVRSKSSFRREIFMRHKPQTKILGPHGVVPKKKK